MIITKKSRAIIYFFLVGLVVFLVRNVMYFEPPFAVNGETEVLRKLHINVRISKYKNPSLLETLFLNENSKSHTSDNLVTIFFNGKSYAADNSDMVYEEIYINYDNKLFSHYHGNNIPFKIGDDSLADNTFFACKKFSDIYISNNKSIKCDATYGNVKLLSFDEEIKKEWSEGYSGITKDDFIKDLKNGFNEIKVQN